MALREQRKPHCHSKSCSSLVFGSAAPVIVPITLRSMLMTWMPRLLVQSSESPFFGGGRRSLVFATAGAPCWKLLVTAACSAAATSAPPCLSI